MAPSKRDLLSAADLSGDELTRLFAAARELKAPGAESKEPLRGRCVALLFEKPSLRTRVSFEVGAGRLGARTIYLSPQEVGLGRRETVEDAALTLSRFVDVIVARTFDHETLVELARHASVPVINALSDAEHPCQAFADLLTLLERRGRLAGTRIAYVGDGNNVAASLCLAATRVGVSVSLASPEGFELPGEVVERANEAATDGAGVRRLRDPVRAVAGADAIYTDVWTSMGQEEEQAARRAAFADYRVDEALVQEAHPEAIVLHCLPAHYDEEIEHSVAHGPRSAIFDQAENRLHVQQALLAFLTDPSNARR